MQGKTILHHTFLLTLANLALRSVSLLFQVYLADRVGAAGMGKMQLILTAGFFAMTLGSSGVRVASMNLTAREYGRGNLPGMKNVIKACLVYSGVLSVVAASLLWGLAPWIAATFVKDTTVVPAIGILAASLPAACLVSVLSGYFTARGKIRSLVIIEVAERLISIGFTVVLLHCWAGDSSLRICCSVIGGSAFSTLLSLLWMLALLYRELCTIPTEKSSCLQPLLQLCIPLALSDYLRSGLSTLEQFLIPRGLSKAGSAYDTSMADYGTISGMVFPVLMFPAAVFHALADLLVPELSGCRVRGQWLRIRHIVTQSLHIGTVFSALVAGIMYILAEPLCRMLYSSEAAGRYLQTFSPLILILYLDAIADGMLKGLGEQVASVRYNTITAALDVLFLYLLLPRWGIGGFFFSFTVTHIINFALSLGRLSKVTGYVPQAAHAFMTIAAALLCIMLTSRLVRPVTSLYSMILSALVYTASFLLLSVLTGALTKYDLQRFLPKKESLAA